MAITFERKDLGRVVNLEIDPSFDPELANAAKILKNEKVTATGRILAIRENGIFIEATDGIYEDGRKIQYEIPYSAIKREI